MADELVDIVDENNNLTGVQKMKSEAHRDGLWHRASHIWIYNSKGEVLLQLRAKNKPLYPDMWDISAAGHVSAGEDPIVSGLREIEEEIGLKVSEADLQLFKIRKKSSVYKDIVNSEFNYVYLLKYDGGVEDLKLLDGEVQALKFLPIEKVKSDLQSGSGSYVPHNGYWSEMLGEMEKRVFGE